MTSRLAFLVALTILQLNLACSGGSNQSGGRRGATTQPGTSDSTPSKKDKNKDKQDKDDDNIDVELPNGDDEDEQDDTNQDDGDDRCYKGDATVCAAEYKIFELTNKVRAGRGLQPLKFSKKASYVARGWSKQQAQGGFISHAGFPSARQSDYQREFGERFNSGAENVAMTGGAQDPAQDFVQMWVGSFGHLQNMLGNHAVLGVGIAQSSDGSWYATQIFGDD